MTGPQRALHAPLSAEAQSPGSNATQAQAGKKNGVGRHPGSGGGAPLLPQDADQGRGLPDWLGLPAHSTRHRGAIAMSRKRERTSPPGGYPHVMTYEQVQVGLDETRARLVPCEYCGGRGVCGNGLQGLMCLECSGLGTLDKGGE